MALLKYFMEQKLSQILLLCNLLVIVSSAQLDLSQCRKYVRRGDGYVCYSEVGTENTWDGASALCSARSMTLLTVLTPAENDAVVDLLETTLSVDSWLGASASTGHWRWLDGTEIKHHGCFNDNPSSPDLEEKMEFPTTNNENVCVQHCLDRNYAYAGLQAAVQCWCGNSFGHYGQSDKCQMSCPGQGGNCGGQSSQIIIATKGSYSNWELSQPDNYQDNQNCASLDGNDNKATWRDVDCRDTNWALCTIVDPKFNCNQRGAKWTQAGRCLYVVQKALSYFNARYECGKLGGDLVMIKSQDENTEIANFLRSQFSSSSFRYWIGLIKQDWHWQTDELFLYNNWSTSEPTGINDLCATIKRGNNDVEKGRWSTVGCLSSRYFICQSTNSSRNSTLSGMLPVVSTTRPPIGPPRTAPTISTRRSGSPGSPGGEPVKGEGGGKKNGLSKGELIAVIAAPVGGVLLILLIIIIIVACCCCNCCCCHRRSKKKNGSADGRKADATNSSDNRVEDTGPAYFFGMDSTTPTVTTLDTAGKKKPKNGNPDVVPTAPSHDGRSYL